MIFRFRVCRNNDTADTAQGWVVASSEFHARALVGEHSYFQRVSYKDEIGIPLGAILVTEGSLEKR